jgi:hypothetical protein
MSSLEVATESGVVLETVAGTVLVNGESRKELGRVGGAKSVGELHAGRETLPRVVGLRPPAITLQKKAGQSMLRWETVEETAKE